MKGGTLKELTPARGTEVCHRCLYLASVNVGLF